jgi:hypothetical protein
MQQREFQIIRRLALAMTSRGPDAVAQVAADPRLSHRKELSDARAALFGSRTSAINPTVTKACPMAAGRLHEE